MLQTYLKKGWQKDFAVCIFLGAVIFIIFLPFFSGRILFGYDVDSFEIPAFKFYSDMLHKGMSFYLNPYIFSGHPLYLSQLGAFLDPVNLLFFKFLPFLTAYNLRVFLNYWLAAIFMFLLGREFKLSRSSALVMAFALITTKSVTSGMNMLVGNTFFFLPGIFYVVQKIFNDDSLLNFYRRLAFIFLGAVIVYLSFLSGNSQFNLYSLVILGFFLLYLRAQRKFSRPFLLSIFFILALGAIATLPYVSRVAEYISFSSRAQGVSFKVAINSDPHFNVLPQVRYIFSQLFYPPWDLNDNPLIYIGFLNVFFVIFAWAKLRKNFLILFFTAAFLFSVLSSFPYPFFWLMHNFPGFQYFRVPLRWLFVASFSFSVLAGLGFESLTKIKSENSLLASARNLFTRRKNFLLVVLPILFLQSFVPAWQVTRKIVFPAQNFLDPPKVIKYITSLNTNGEPFRSFPLSTGVDAKDLLRFKEKNYSNINPEEDIQKLNQEALGPSNLVASQWGLSFIGGSDPFLPARYKQVLSHLESEKPNFLKSGKLMFVPRLEDLVFYISSSQLELLGMMNVKYFWSILPLVDSQSTPLTKLLTVLHPLEDYRIPLYVYENKRFMSRIYSPRKIIILPKDEDNFYAIINTKNDFHEAGFIECEGCKKEELLQFPPDIKNAEFLNDSINFETSAKKEAFAIISNSFVPRWHAFIDGEETKLYYANYIYQGIKIPEGDHKITLKYKF